MLRNVQDWNKYVDLLGKAVAKRPSTAPRHGHENGRENGYELARALPLDLLDGPASPAAPPRAGRGPRKEETREELLRRLMDPTLTLEETACILEVCPTTVRRYTNRGILPHERSAGNQRRFKLSSVLAFKEDRQKPLEAGDGPQDGPQDGPEDGPEED